MCVTFSRDDRAYGNVKFSNTGVCANDGEKDCHAADARAPITARSPSMVICP